MQPKYQILFLVRYIAPFNIGSQIIHPSQPATLPTSI